MVQILGTMTQRQESNDRRRVNVLGSLRHGQRGSAAQTAGARDALSQRFGSP